MRHLENHRLRDVHVVRRVGVTLDGGDEFRLAGPGGDVSTFARQAQCSRCALFGFHALSVGSPRKQAASDAPIPSKRGRRRALGTWSPEPVDRIRIVVVYRPACRPVRVCSW